MNEDDIEEDKIERAIRGSELYEGLQKLMDDFMIKDIVHILSYTLAEIAIDADAPKTEFTEYFMDAFDNAHDHIIKARSH